MFWFVSLFLKLHPIEFGHFIGFTLGCLSQSEQHSPASSTSSSGCGPTLQKRQGRYHFIQSSKGTCIWSIFIDASAFIEARGRDVHCPFQWLFWHFFYNFTKTVALLNFFFLISPLHTPSIWPRILYYQSIIYSSVAPSTREMSLFIIHVSYYIVLIS